MKWVRKKSSNQASSRLPSLSQVFPMSWFSKFKQMSSKSETQQTKAKRKSIPKSPSLNSLSPVSFKPSRLHRGELCFSPEVAGGRIGRRTRPLNEMDGDDDFWRLSFGGESFEGKKSKGPLRSVWYDSDDELEFPFSSCHSCRSVKTKMGAKDESQKFTDMVSDIRKLRNSPVDVGISPENFTSKGLEFGTPSKKILKDRRVTDRKSRKTTEENGRSSTQVKRVLDFEPVTTIQPTENENSRHSVHISSSDTRKSNIKTEEENGKVAALNSETTDQILAEESDLEWKKAEDLKIEKLMLKSEKQRKSPDKSRELQRKRTKQGCKVRVNSPRTPSKVEVCKIKALEDMKKAKMKMKTKTEAKSMDERTDLESLAVVKCSFNPQKDFRDSMVEMISENGISRPEEMEDLLACYLSLNSDEFHDLIIKVFRQVWFDLNQACSGPELQKDHCHNDCK